MSTPATFSEFDRTPVRSYVRRFWRPFTLGIGTLALTNFFDILTPFALKRAIDAITGHDPGALRDSILLYLAFMVGAVSFRHQWRIHFGRFQHSVSDDVRRRLFDQYMKLGPRFFEKNQTGELMSLMINDVNTFRMAIGPALLILFDAFFIIAFVLPFMLTISVSWAWKTMILLPLIPFVIRYMEDRIAKASRDQQDRLAELSGYTQELVTGIRVVKGFAQEDNRLRFFKGFSDRYRVACNSVAKLDAMWEPALQFGVSTGAVILLVWASPDVMVGVASLGTFVAFHEYIKRMIWPMAAIGSGLSMLQQGRSSYARLAEVLATKPDVVDSGTGAIDAIETIEFRDLKFTYPDATQPALDGISFAIKRGERLGIVGPVGSGKSTLIHLLTRVRPAPAQSIFINGQAVEEIAATRLRERMAVVPQDAFLFSRTVADNVIFGRDTTAAEAEIDPVAFDVVDVVAMREEVDRLPLGFRAWLGEKGVNLSGGQRQRLSVARALARFDAERDLLILDDSLSAVDTKTEASILSSLNRSLNSSANCNLAAPQATTMIVSHRLAVMAAADRILVLNEGRVEAIGTHMELLRTSATYRRLAELQNEAGRNAEGVAAASTGVST